jgi:hypothetical protein
MVSISDDGPPGTSQEIWRKICCLKLKSCGKHADVIPGICAFSSHNRMVSKRQKLMKLAAILVVMFLTCGMIAIAARATESKDLSQADEGAIIKSAKEDAAVLWYGAHQGFSHGANMLENAWNGAVNLLFTKMGLEKEHNLLTDSPAKKLYDDQLDQEYSRIVDAGGLENYDPKATPTPTPGPVTSTIAPMPKEMGDKIKAERLEKEEEKRKLFEKQEAEREARGDFSQAPGLTPGQKEVAEIRWAEKDAAQSIKDAKPASQ